IHKSYNDAECARRSCLETGQIIGWRTSVDRRTATFCTGIAVLGMAFTALPNTNNIAPQIDPWIGSWQLNVTKSTFGLGPPPRSQSAKIEGTKQNRKATLAGVDATGNGF